MTAMNAVWQAPGHGALDYAYSGTVQGAGGVGGLLASTLHDGASSQTFLPSFDGNGNISAWSDPGGALLTRTDYSPFGQVVARYRLGPPGDTRPDRLAFGFSTKYTDAESGLLYYGYRYLDPVSGRWLSRDPIGENGGVNLYGFVGNRPIQTVDVLGLRDQFQDGDVEVYMYLENLAKQFEERKRKNRMEITKECCDYETIAKGRFELLRRFIDIKRKFKMLERKKGAPPSEIDAGRASEMLSCHNMNSDLIDGLFGQFSLIRKLDGQAAGIPDDDLGFPSCWQCELEHRSREEFSPQRVDGFIPWSFTLGKIYDHHFVVCKAYDQSGLLVDEMLFDLWNPNAKNGSSPSSARKDYPVFENSDDKWPLGACSK